MTPLRWGALVLGVFAVVVLGTFVGVYLVIDHAPAPKSPAAYLPPGTQAYFSVNIDPESDQTAKLKAIYGRFKAVPGFDDVIKEALAGEFDGGFAPDLAQDILPWLGPEIAVGLISFEAISEDIADPPELIIFVGTTGPDATKSSLERLIEADDKAEFETGSYGGHITYTETASDSPAFMAVTGEYLLIATTQALLEATIDNMASPVESLAGEARFQEAQEAVEDPRFGFLFLDVKALADFQMKLLEQRDGSGLSGVVPGILPGVGGLGTLAASVGENAPEFLSASVTALDDALWAFTSGTVPEGSPGAGWSNAVESANRVPADSLALVSSGGVQESWDQFLAQLSATAGADSGDIEAMLDGFGLDLEQDLLAWMSGEAAVALLPPIEYIDEVPVVHVLALLEYSDEPAAQSGMEKALGALAGLAGGSLERTTLDGVEATLLDLEFLLPPGYSPGFVVMDGYLALGTTTESLKVFIGASDGSLPSLGGSPEFARLLEQAGGEADALVYASIDRGGEALAMLSGPLSLADFEEEAAPFFEQFGDFILVYNTSETLFTAQSVITFD